MPEYLGSANVVIFNGTAGSINLHPDIRSLAITPTITKVDSTAGQDTSKQYLPSFTEWTVTVTGVLQNGTAGLAQGTILLPGVIGTLSAYPAGSSQGAGTNLKYQMVAMCGGAVVTSPYSDVTTFSVEFSTSSGGTMAVGTA